MPFIRYELGDLAVFKGYNKEGNMIIDSIQGRINDIIVLPSGKLSPGLTFYYISKKILEGGTRLREFYIVQKSKEHFELVYTADIELDEISIQRVVQAMDQYLEPGLTLKVKKVNKIEKAKSGKFKHFISEIL